MPPPFGFKRKQVAHDAKDVRLPFFRRNKLFDPVGEKDESDLVVVTNRRECQDRTDFRCDFIFHRSGRPEIFGTAQVDEQHHRQLAFFLKNFDKRMIESGGDVPIDRADIVSILVFADFGEFHAASFKDRMVFAGEDVVHQPPCLDFNLPYFFEKLLSGHCFNYQYNDQ